jgi:hypothetical protein
MNNQDDTIVMQKGEDSGAYARDDDRMQRPARSGGGMTKYTPKTVKLLLNAISDGLTVTAACVVANITDSCLSDWKKKYPDFAHKIDLAREQGALKHLNIIKTAGENGDWRASEAFLKLTRPEIFRRQPDQQQKHLHVHGNTVVTLSPERQEEIRAQIKRIRAAMAPESEREKRIQPTGLLVSPEGQQPVQEAEVIEEPPTQSVRSGSMPPMPQSQSEALQEMWRTYQRNGSDEQSGNDDVPRLR